MRLLVAWAVAMLLCAGACALGALVEPTPEPPCAPLCK